MANKEYQQELLTWYAMMMGALAAMPVEERNELERWEALRLDGESISTSDWPGWEKYIEKKPQSPKSAKISYQKQPIPSDIRWQVWERDNFTCQNCKSRRNLTIDHIYPEVLGGTLDLGNLQTLCKFCNSKKRDRVI